MVTGDGRLGFVSQNVSQYLRYTQVSRLTPSFFIQTDELGGVVVVSILL